MQKERAAVVLRNQIGELKDQLKGGKGGAEDATGLKAKVVELEARVAKQAQESLVAGAQGVNIKINQVVCSGKHSLKQKSQHPFSAEVNCDICAKGNLINMPFFFRCDYNCNYDICAFCYYLELTDQKALIQSIRTHSQQTKAQ